MTAVTVHDDVRRALHEVAGVGHLHDPVAEDAAQGLDAALLPPIT